MGNDEILAFLRAIDERLVPHAIAGESLDLHLIGRSALILGFGVRLATKDVDIVHVHGSTLQDWAVATFGKGTLEAERLGFYLEPVPQGLPPIPGGYFKRSTPVPGTWRAIRPMQPEPHDLAVTKLSRFHAGDQQDIQILCDSAGLDPDRLRAALDSAFAFAADEDEDPKRERAYANLRRVIAYLEGKTKRP